MREATTIVAVLDRSGSMGTVRSDAIGGFNTFLREQKANPQPADLRIVLFDSKYETLYSGDIQEAPELTVDTFVPRGMTALLDALGKSINETGEHLAKLPEDQRPNRVIFVILTDGEENASREFTREQVFDLITHQKEKYSWQFVFLAANQDAITTGKELGMNFASSYASTKIGTRSAYETISAGLTKVRFGQAVTAADFTVNEKKGGK